jgi:hypothetical protein
MKKMGDEPAARAKRRREIEEMSEKDMLVEIKKTQADVRERVDCACQRRKESSLGKLPVAMMMLRLVVMQSRLADAFTTYDCSNRSNIVVVFGAGTRCVCGIRQDTNSR